VGYVIAAYAIVIGTLALYGVLLARERRRLASELARGGETNRG
jgi:hypothetical protein